jgi:ubiquitin-conjugating enzyme E2 I
MLTLVYTVQQERKRWRKDHPVGFYARPLNKGDGSTNIFQWECGIPGKAGTDWEGGVYKVVLHFTSDYPSQAPTVTFTPPIFHPNVFGSGKVCLSILTKAWTPGISVRQILVGVQDLLDTPNKNDPANGPANQVYSSDKAAYKKRVQAEALKHKPVDVF